MEKEKVKREETMGNYIGFVGGGDKVYRDISALRVESAKYEIARQFMEEHRSMLSPKVTIGDIAHFTLAFRVEKSYNQSPEVIIAAVNKYRSRDSSE